MSESVLIYNALCLPAPDVEALIQGRMIAATPRKFINPGQKFALYPANVSVNSLPPKRHYRSSFLPIAQQVMDNSDSETVLIKAWARCERCEMLDASESLESFLGLTVWTTEALQQTRSQRPYIFLAYLRVYLLSQPLEVPVYTLERHFVPLSQQLTVSQENPVLGDRLFTIRKHQLETRQPPLHPELEELQSALASLTITNPAAKQLDQDIKAFLGWTTEELIQQPDPDLAWINNIAALGDRSKEQDEGKSNYQAGTEFENIVRKSLEFLGFTVDYFHKGGAGGVDVFCSQPYPLIGECKAGKKIPNDTAVQLLNLGTLRLQSQELFEQATKLIIGPGEPTTQLKDAAKVHCMTIINPETLEKLVKLQSKYPNSVDLFKLKEYLKVGQSDQEVEKYITKVNQDIKLRSQLVQLVKKYLENTGFERASVDSLHGAFSATSLNKLQPQEMHEILIELSSPLTGYLGRIKGENWRRDRFYFLRDLPTPQI
ncbi:hypothetical protein SAMD00079811_24790 [Scytonema sp. HK-05]|uniref:DUF1802 family protein n=1 Tax=Scytonema sp. HK-05 TaxID=1137095 RepID=UPI000936374A|nr:DUF1802 family protein [Scytonema sp. HK-05]OKH44493.1 DUF1802 domain-containing protein [Scytonema sp. HK-05]BAY44877.1 hypothetical protein SAMD00079811_24790 [Scytonema sp. HK-05]